MIKSVTLIAALLAAQATLAGAPAKEAASIKIAKERIEDQLTDPSSVQYRRVFVNQHATNGTMVCGELNAKNQYGGYTGFRQFISSVDSLVYMGDQIYAIWDEYCGKK